MITFGDLAKTKEDAYFHAQDQEILARRKTSAASETPVTDLNTVSGPKAERSAVPTAAKGDAGAEK